MYNYRNKLEHLIVFMKIFYDFVDINTKKTKNMHYCDLNTLFIK